MDILVFGASGTYGAWDIESGWVRRLRKFLDKENIKDLENFTLTYNLGISGDTSEDILDRFDSEIKSHLRGRKKARFIIFSIGVNDSRLINGKPAVSKEKFRKNIISLITKAKEHTASVIFMGLAPIYPKFVEWSDTETYDMADVMKYNEIVEITCKKNKINFVEILSKLMNLDYKKLLQDELHYNTEGHKKFFEIVRDFLVKNKLVKL